MYNRSVNQIDPRKQEYVDILWDLFKDVHGVRPRGMDYGSWPVEDLHDEIVRLQRSLDAQLERERAEQAAMYDSIMAVGCPSQEDADRWIEDAYWG